MYISKLTIYDIQTFKLILSERVFIRKPKSL